MYGKGRAVEFVVGIDPGATGGVAVLRGRELVWARPLPTTVRIKGVRGVRRSSVDALALVRLLGEVLGTAPLVAGVRAYVEGVSAAPGQGAAASFTFGRSAEAVDVACELLALDVKHVSPVMWKGALGLGTDKRRAVARAHEILGPGAETLIGRHDGMAEAALVAWYGITIDF